ncbi:MAG: Zn-ribbon domain-containing OB-fold protein [Candidatus Freyarchaeota archaeon]|nr:Zn-ribbon domain-containing OB-fold protein [Candidatus Jordarchaeia archaeon]
MIKLSSQPEIIYLQPKNHEPTLKFWEGLKNRKLLAPRCGDCGEIFFPPRGFCPKCLSENIEWVELSGKGKLHSWTEIHYLTPKPYILGVIDLAEGIGRMISRIEAEHKELKIDMPMKVDFIDVSDKLTLFIWRPDKVDSKHQKSESF